MLGVTELFSNAVTTQDIYGVPIDDGEFIINDSRGTRVSPVLRVRQNAVEQTTRRPSLFELQDEAVLSWQEIQNWEDELDDLELALNIMKGEADPDTKISASERELELFLEGDRIRLDEAKKDWRLFTLRVERHACSTASYSSIPTLSPSELRSFESDTTVVRRQPLLAQGVHYLQTAVVSIQSRQDLDQFECKSPI